VDIRVVSATHRDLQALVDREQFRGDLLGRLREVSIHLPPLRERREDLFPLVLHFLHQLGHTTPQVSFPFMLAVGHYDWPYNVRELESAVRVAHTLSGGQPLDLQHLPETTRAALEGHGANAGPPLRMPEAAVTLRDGNQLRSALDSVRKSDAAPNEDQLRSLLTHHRGNIAAVGAALGKHRMQVHRWLRRYNIDVNDYREKP
jgi:sigma-54 dependent transcriptional regulator, acetoin dehydrogenase operon transcriptional activator AcoR